MSEYDILIHASTLPEPFGITIIEGMAAGLACVASNIGGPVEIITPGVDGMLFDAGDPHSLAQVWKELLRNNELRTKIATNGKQTALMYDRQTVLSRYTTFIEHTIATNEKE